MSPARSPPAFFRRGGASNDELPQHEEPDETTEIITRAPSSGAHPAMNYQSTVESAGTRARKAGAERGGDSPADETRRPGDARSASKGRAPLAGPGAGNGAQNGHGAAGGKDEKAWWKTKLEYFGSIELENKGSVARDHLALGRQAPNHRRGGRRLVVVLDDGDTGVQDGLRLTSTCRADIPRVAADVTGLRLHRRRHHPALPAQHLHRGQPVRQRGPAHPAPPGQAPRRRVPRHQHPGPLPRLPQVLPGAEVHHTGQVPGEPRDRHPGVARGAGADGDIPGRRRCRATELSCRVRFLGGLLCDEGYLSIYLV